MGKVKALNGIPLTTKTCVPCEKKGKKDMVVTGDNVCTARASITEEPDAGKPHVRICMGGFAQVKFLP